MTDGKVSLEKAPRVVVQVHGWYPLVVLVLVFVMVTVLNVLYTNHVDQRRQEADRRAAAAAQIAAREQNCRLIVAFDDLYKETQPTSPAGVKVAELWAEYRVALNC